MAERVLLVDDEEEFTRVLAERMESRGLKVDTAASGSEALEKVKASSYDAILLDLVMPELDGLETMKKLLRQRPELQVIFLTGQATVQKGIDAVKHGAVEFLEKPADIDQLMEKIREARAKKAMLVAKQTEVKIKEILGTKAW